MSSLMNEIFEAMGNFAITVEFLVKAGWSFKCEPGDHRYCDPVLHVTKGERKERCSSTEEVERLVPIAQGIFDKSWNELSEKDAFQGYDEGFEDGNQGWCRDENGYWMSTKYKEGYLKGLEDAKNLCLKIVE